MQDRLQALLLVSALAFVLLPATLHLQAEADVAPGRSLLSQGYLANVPVSQGGYKRDEHPSKPNGGAKKSEDGGKKGGVEGVKKQESSATKSTVLPKGKEASTTTTTGKAKQEGPGKGRLLLESLEGRSLLGHGKKGSAEGTKKQESSGAKPKEAPKGKEVSGTSTTAGKAKQEGPGKGRLLLESLQGRSLLSQGYLANVPVSQGGYTRDEHPSKPNGGAKKSEDGGKKGSVEGTKKQESSGTKPKEAPKRKSTADAHAKGSVKENGKGKSG